MKFSKVFKGLGIKIIIGLGTLERFKDNLGSKVAVTNVVHDIGHRKGKFTIFINSSSANP